MDKCIPKAESNKIYRCRSAGSENNFLPAFSIDKVPYSIASCLIFVCRFLGKPVDAPMDIGIGLRCKSVPHIYDLLRPLGCRSVVKINEIFSVNLSGKYRKHRSYVIN